MSDPANNQHAAKNKGYDSKLNVECKKADKDQWKEAADYVGRNLTDWTNQVLNKEVLAHCEKLREEHLKDTEGKL